MMNTPNFEAARDHALARLSAELPGDLFYHNLGHTRDDVAPAAARLAAAEGVASEDLLLLLTAAYYHDLGYVERYTQNEPAAAAIAVRALPRFGYTLPQIEVVAGLILATRLPRAPATLLQSLLDDADLDVLGRPDFLEKNALLRRELAARGETYDDATWYRDQITFLESHRYFTAAARRERCEGVQENIALLSARMDGLEARSG